MQIELDEFKDIAAKLQLPLGRAARARLRLIISILTAIFWLFVGSFVYVELEECATQQPHSSRAAAAQSPSLLGLLAACLSACLTRAPCMYACMSLAGAVGVTWTRFTSVWSR
jgi:hypothetical protein